ncbi:MAG: hypothetical protein U1D30_07015 [Planctomycetota bacterium]
MVDLEGWTSAAFVELDQDGDGLADATATIDSSDLHAGAGGSGCGWRQRFASAVDVNGEETETWGLNSISFTYDPAMEFPKFVGLDLPNDTGDPDGITADATITGFVQFLGGNAFLSVEYDVDGDELRGRLGTADESGSLACSRPTPWRLACTPFARSAFDASRNVGVQSDWESFASLFVSAATTTFGIDNLSLIRELGTPGNSETDDPVLKGFVTGLGSLSFRPSSSTLTATARSRARRSRMSTAASFIALKISMRARTRSTFARSNGSPAGSSSRERDSLEFDGPTGARWRPRSPSSAFLNDNGRQFQRWHHHRSHARRQDRKRRVGFRPDG